MFQRLRQMLIKEFLQVLRDKRARTLLFLPPMIQMMVFGYAATFEIRNVTTAIVDQQDHRSRYAGPQNRQVGPRQPRGHRRVEGRPFNNAAS